MTKATRILTLFALGYPAMAFAQSSYDGGYVPPPPPASPGGYSGGQSALTNEISSRGVGANKGVSDLSSATSGIAAGGGSPSAGTASKIVLPPPSATMPAVPIPPNLPREKDKGKTADSLD